MVSVLSEVFASIPFQSVVLAGSHIQTGEMDLRGMWGISTSQRDGKKKCLPVQWLHMLYLMAIIHIDWQGQALPLHLSMDCQCLLSQVNLTDLLLVQGHTVKLLRVFCHLISSRML